MAVREACEKRVIQGMSESDKFVIKEDLRDKNLGYNLIAGCKDRQDCRIEIKSDAWTGEATELREKITASNRFSA